VAQITNESFGGGGSSPYDHRVVGAKFFKGAGNSRQW